MADFDAYTTAGLTKAQELMNKTPVGYPSYVSSAAKSPTQQAYYQYKATDPMAQITAPDYQLKTGDSQDWSQWTPGGSVQYSEVNPTAKAADYSFQTYGQTAPQYRGLMSGDYEALQNALILPGSQAARTAYDTGYTNLKNNMGAQGLYGSSIMQNQALNNLDRVYQDALASNAAKAAATRYGMQQTDLTNASAQDMAAWQARLNESLAGNSANLDYAKILTALNQQNTANELQQAQSLNALRGSDAQQLQGLMSAQNLAKNEYLQKAREQDLGRESDMNKYNAQMFQLGEQQNKDVFASNAALAEMLNNYNLNRLTWDKTNMDNLTTWENAQNYEKNFLYPQQQAAYQNQLDEMMMNRALALSGQGAPLTQAASNYQLAQQQLAAQQQAARDASSAATTSSYLGAAGLLGGGLLSSNGFWNYLNS